MNVDLKFEGGPVTREMRHDDAGVHVRVDYDADGRMVAAHFTGVTVAAVNGDRVASEAGAEESEVA